MTESEQRARLCECVRNGHRFDISEAIGKCIVDKKCPECGSRIRFVQVPSYLDKYLYINSDTRYFEYKGQRRKLTGGK